MNVGTIHHLMDPIILVGAESKKSALYLQKTKVQCISSAQKFFLYIFMDYCFECERMLDW